MASASLGRLGRWSYQTCWGLATYLTLISVIYIMFRSTELSSINHITFLTVECPRLSCLPRTRSDINYLPGDCQKLTLESVEVAYNYCHTIGLQLWTYCSLHSEGNHKFFWMINDRWLWFKSGFVPFVCWPRSVLSKILLHAPFKFPSKEIVISQD